MMKQKILQISFAKLLLYLLAEILMSLDVTTIMVALKYGVTPETRDEAVRTL